MAPHQNTQDTQSAMKFASFHLAFSMRAGMGNTEDVEPQARLAWLLRHMSSAPMRVDLCQVLHRSWRRLGRNVSSVLVTGSLPGEFSACLWNTTEGMLLAGRVWEHSNGHSCFPHSMCRIFSFLVYSAINCFVIGPLFWAQLSLELGLLVCFCSCSISSACLPAWLTPSVPLPLSPRLPLRALSWTQATAMLLLCVLPWSDLLSVEQCGKVC